MALVDEVADAGTSAYVVTCEECEFERRAEDLADAQELGDAHYRDTEHTIVALEWPY